MSNAFIKKINYVIDFLSAFIDGKFKKEIPIINQAIKGFSFGQAAIDTAIIINADNNHSLSISLLILLVPIFLTMGVTTGLFTRESESNSRVTTIGIIAFIFITATHAVVILFHCLIISTISALALIVGIIISINLLSYCFKIYFSSQEKNSEK